MIVRQFNKSEDVDLLYKSKFREADVQEFKAYGIDNIPDAVVTMSGVPGADIKVVLTDEGQLVSVGGLLPLKPGDGSPWMVATDLFDKHSLSLIKTIKPIFDEYLESYDWLTGHVDVRNNRAVKFLSWLGFSFPKGCGFHIGGTYFQRFGKNGKPLILPGGFLMNPPISMMMETLTVSEVCSLNEEVSSGGSHG